MEKIKKGETVMKNKRKELTYMNLLEQYTILSMVYRKVLINIIVSNDESITKTPLIKTFKNKISIMVKTIEDKEALRKLILSWANNNYTGIQS
jgi:hypothetical protein